MIPFLNSGAKAKGPQPQRLQPGHGPVETSKCIHTCCISALGVENGLAFKRSRSSTHSRPAE